MVEHVLAKDEVGVRFSSVAHKSEQYSRVELGVELGDRPMVGHKTLDLGI